MNFRHELLNNIFPFWLMHGIDWENGGIFTCLDQQGNIYGEEKSVWFQGRALWTFSRVYSLLQRDPAYLEAARNIYDFLAKCTDDDGRMFFTVTKEGKPIQKRRYYFSETFAAIGCAEYYRASGNEKALSDAAAYFDVAWECFQGKRESLPKFYPENHNFKALSPVMIMLSTAQTMRSIDHNNAQKYDRIAKTCLDEILNGGFLTDRGLLESVTREGRFSDTPTGRVVNPGHSMEAAWFVLLEGIVTKDSAAVAAGKKIIDLTLPLGWDKKYGGIIAFTDVSGQPPVQLEWDMKLWWPQCETMIALRLAYMLFKEEHYRESYEKLKSYCADHFVDAENGEWFGYLHYDNTLSTTLKGNIFKGPFHIPRMYIIMAVLDEMGCIEPYAV